MSTKFAKIAKINPLKVWFLKMLIKDLLFPFYLNNQALIRSNKNYFIKLNVFFSLFWKDFLAIT